MVCLDGKVKIFIEKYGDSSNPRVVKTTRVAGCPDFRLREILKSLQISQAHFHVGRPEDLADCFVGYWPGKSGLQIWFNARRPTLRSSSFEFSQLSR
jgi:hypothetical protein